MSVKKSIKLSLFKKIDGRAVLIIWITTLVTLFRYIDTSELETFDYIYIIAVSGVPVVATLLNIEIPSTFNLLKELVKIVTNGDLDHEQKLKMIENTLIIAVHEWNNVNKMAEQLVRGYDSGKNGMQEGSG